MKIHQVKEWPATYDETARNVNRIQFRKNDRNYQAGDVMVITLFDPLTCEYANSTVVKRIASVQESIHLPPGYVAMVIEPMSIAQQTDVMAHVQRVECTPAGASVLSHIETDGASVEAFQNKLFDNAEKVTAKSMGF